MNKISEVYMNLLKFFFGIFHRKKEPIFKDGQKIWINGKEYTVKMELTDWGEGGPNFSTSKETWQLAEDKYLLPNKNKE